MNQNTRVALLLEDEPFIALDIEEQLEGAGFSVMTFPSCPEAGSWLDNHRPDLAIVDIMMRDGTSIEIASKLVAADIPFIVHSGDHPSMHKDTPFAQGIWVEKPCNSEDLVRAAEMLLGR